MELWCQAGWREEHFDMEELLKHYIPAGTIFIAEQQGAIAGEVGTMPGNYRHCHSDIQLCAVTSVVIAIEQRRRAVGSDLTRRALRQALAEGAEVALLGAFDLGYYNRLGFGNGLPHRMIIIDPADIITNGAPPNLRKLTKTDVPAMHEARLRRYPVHGACSLYPSGFTASIAYATAPHALALGIYHRKKLTAHLWAVVKDDVTLTIEWWAADSPQHWLELLRGVASLQDQVQRIIMPYPARICLEDLLKSPCRRTRGMIGNENNPYPPPEYWQIRILDVVRCIQKSSLAVEQPYRFNLRVYGEAIEMPSKRGVVSDPQVSEYNVALGEHSECHAGHSKALPLLECSIGAFSRLWCGAYSASTLVLSDHFNVSEERMVASLDRLFALPTPMCDWYF